MKYQTKLLKENPLLAWEILWFSSPLIIAFKNAVARGNSSLVLSDVIIFAVIMGLVWAVLALVGWFVIKLVYKSISGGKELRLKQVLILWLVMFLILFSLSLFK